MKGPISSTYLKGDRAGWRRCFWPLMLSGLIGEPAMGAMMEIRASFRPDPSNPVQNKFTNETPVRGHCELQPVFCKERDLFSLLMPIGFQSVGPIERGHTDQRKGAMFRVPGDWQRLSVTHSQTQEVAEVELRIVSIGGRYTLPDTAENLVGEGPPTSVQGWHTRLWGDWTWAPPAPCQPTGGMYTAPSTRTFFWLTSGTSVCAARANYPIATLTYDRMQIGYELRTPKPLNMSSGQYNGQWTYSVGRGRDFDMGDIMQPDDSTLTFNFNLNVEHVLKVDLPPGGNQVILEPQGGWQGWLDRGSKPTALLRDQTFLISASSRFTMKLECEWELVNGCAIIDRQTGIGGVVNVSVSLPHGLVNSSGQPVSHLPLSRTESAPFQPGFYVDRKPGTLHFEMSERSTSQVVEASAGRPFKGNITVVWDSQV
ncbi:hypothetical protein ACQKP7_06605 [Pseudomonas frederiksbergensis]|uniref:hypothetical protein n=1 Tax=Pseudomonas frederiksbergensis TaxID=104087 RepID=UPI003D0118A1